MCLDPTENNGPVARDYLYRDSGFQSNPLRRHGEGRRGGFFVADVADYESK